MEEGRRKKGRKEVKGENREEVGGRREKEGMKKRQR